MRPPSLSVVTSLSLGRLSPTMFFLHPLLTFIKLKKYCKTSASSCSDSQCCLSFLRPLNVPSRPALGSLGLKLDVSLYLKRPTVAPLKLAALRARLSSLARLGLDEERHEEHNRDEYAKESSKKGGCPIRVPREEDGAVCRCHSSCHSSCLDRHLGDAMHTARAHHARRERGVAFTQSHGRGWGESVGCVDKRKTQDHGGYCPHCTSLSLSHRTFR